MQALLLRASANFMATCLNVMGDPSGLAEVGEKSVRERTRPQNAAICMFSFD